MTISLKKQQSLRGEFDPFGLLASIVTTFFSGCGPSSVNTEIVDINNNMVLVEGGCFDMGGDEPEGEYYDEKDYEKPVHKICVDDFYICKYEVTQGQWKELMQPLIRVKIVTQPVCRWFTV